MDPFGRECVQDCFAKHNPNEDPVGLALCIAGCHHLGPSLPHEGALEVSQPEVYSDACTRMLAYQIDRNNETGAGPSPLAAVLAAAAFVTPSIQAECDTYCASSSCGSPGFGGQTCKGVLSNARATLRGHPIWIGFEWAVLVDIHYTCSCTCPS